MARSRSVARPVIGGAGFVFMMLLLAPFVWHAVARGMSFGDPEELATSRFIHAGAALTSGALYLHMVTGGVLSGLVPLQLIGAVRRRWPRWHHLNGYVCGGLALVTGTTGLVYIAAHGTIGGPLMSAGFAVYGLLLMGVAGRTVQLARRRDPRHGAWAGRFIILALASWFFRVQYGLWVGFVGEVGTRPDFTGAFDRVMTFGFYLPWLALYELVRMRRG